MEAKAIHPFDAEAENELPFVGGDTLSILDVSDPNWYKAEKSGRVGFVPSNRVQLKPNDWYQGKMSRDASVSQLHTHGEEGTFLIRESETCPGDFSLSVKHNNNVHHFRIMRTPNFKYYLYEDQVFDSLNKLVEKYRTISASRQNDTILLREPLRPPSAQPNRQEPLIMVAAFDFKAEDEEELDFRAGEHITVIDKKEEHWWVGRNSEGREGMFPTCYCKELTS